MVRVVHALQLILSKCPHSELGRVLEGVHFKPLVSPPTGTTRIFDLNRRPLGPQEMGSLGLDDTKGSAVALFPSAFDYLLVYVTFTMAGGLSGL